MELGSKICSLPSQTKIINILMVWPFKVNSNARHFEQIFECKQQSERMRISIYAASTVFKVSRSVCFLTADHTKNIIDFFILIKQKTKALIKGTLKLIL